MTENAQSTIAILRRKQVQALTGLSRSTLYLRIAQGVFPRPVSLGARAVGWPATEVATLNAARISGKVRLRDSRVGGEDGSGPQDGRLSSARPPS